MEKKIRFGDLVRTSGRPQTHTLWTVDPLKDHSFRQATRENRVLTVMQPAKGKAYGLVGFHKEPRAVYLLFPRALARDQNTRVIGINYQLMEEPDVSDPVRAGKTKPRKTEVKPKRVEKEFKVILRRTATIETILNLQASDRKQAEKEALKLAEDQPIDLNQATISTEITRVE